MRPIYCCIPIEFIQPWDQNEAIRRIKECSLGNMVMIQGTFHVGNSEAERRRWKETFPHLAEKIDATPVFPERPEHGMCALFDMPLEFRLEQARLAEELGLQMYGWLLEGQELTPEERVRMRERGVFCETFMGENLSMLGATLSVERLKRLDATPVSFHAASSTVQARANAGPSVFDNPDALDFQVMHDWFVKRFRDYGQALREQYGGQLAAVEASSQIHLALEAGGDIPILELVPHEPLKGIAAVRGAATAYGKELWGVHTAMGYYRAPTDLWTPERLRIADDLFYIAGSSFFSECNMPIRNWGSCSGFFTIAASPPVRWSEKECREFDDPVCVRAREVVSSFYRFTQFHARPDSGPRVHMGYMLGNLDAWAGGHGQRMWLVDDPGFLAPEALATWHHFDRVFDSEPWYIPPRQYYWQADPAKALRHGTPPCGQVDLVPAEAPLEKLQGYGALAFLGWNTMTEALYGKLLGFVEGGGTLFLSVPHLDTRARTDRPHVFLHDGDVRELCGVRILGPGAEVEEVLFANQTASPRHVMPQGTLYLEPAPLAAVELAGARVLAHPRGKPELPVLLEHRVGKGIVYLLATWDYPGDRLDAFITDILRTMAEAEQGEIAVEGRDVFYAVYAGTMPSGLPFSTVYLVNHDIYGQPAYPTLIAPNLRVPVRAANELRIAWLCDGLLVSPHSRFVQVTDVRRVNDGWEVMLEVAPGEEGEQVIQLAGIIASVTLDGQALALERGIEGDIVVRLQVGNNTTVTVIP